MRNVSDTLFTYSCTGPTLPSGTGNINVDPCLAGNFQLQTGSPCIDGGNNVDVVGLYDRAGNMRIVNGGNNLTVDMGAYEYQGSTSSTLTISPTSQSVGSSAGSFSISVTANVSWSVSKDQTFRAIGRSTGEFEGQP